MVIAALTLSSLLAAAAAAVRTTEDGVYTRAQAARGYAVHQRHCAACHAPGYFQGAFLRGWNSVPVAALYGVIELKMPEDRPGELEPEEYSALLAWVFEMNGLPAGDEALGHAYEDLAGILIVTN